jgi:hypothetical protein
MKKSTNVLLAGFTFALALSLASSASAQETQQAPAASPESGLYLTAFPAPATRQEYPTGRLANHPR